MAKYNGTMNRIDPSIEALLANRMMWQDPIAVYAAEQVTNSTLMSRQNLVNRGTGGDPRRDIDAECGYPTEITAEDYRALYEREPIASRVVQVLPMECWQVTPEVYEDEDVEVTTPFEKAFHDLAKTLRGNSLFQDQEGNPIWEALMRIDTLSGIGAFGIVLIGIDDGKPLDQPIEGFQDSLQMMTSLSSMYGTEAQYGALTLMPGEDKPKKPLEVNAAPPFKRPNERLEEDEQGSTYAGPEEEDLNIPPEEDTGDMPEEIPGDPQDMAEEPMEDEQELDENGMPVKGSDMEAVAEEDMAPVTTKYKLLFLRCFDETLVQVVQYESDPTNVRYGQPVTYNITLNDPRYLHGGAGLFQNTVKVHWSRVIHVADNLGSSEVFGTPRMQPVYNRLLDLRKLHSGSAEMYWKGAFPGFNLATHPQLGGDVQFDSEDIKDQMEQYMNGLQRYTAFIGMSMNSLAPQVVDPTTQIQVQIEAICVRLAVPVRVFMGSERGELASSQDAGTWNDRLKQRHNGYLTPKIIVPFVDRLIKIGVLPVPQGFSVVWPDLSAASDLEKAQRANMIATAMSAYVQGGLENVITWPDFLVEVLGFDEAKALQLHENSANQAEEEMMTIDPAMEEEMAQAQMEQMTNPELVPDNIQTGDQHHYEAGSQDKAAELEHERIISGQENGPPQEGGGPPMPPGKSGKGKPMLPPGEGKSKKKGMPF